MVAKKELVFMYWKEQVKRRSVTGIDDHELSGLGIVT